VSSPAARADVRAYACPITYVKTRIALERLAPGEVLEVWLAAGEPERSVPASAAEEGHRVVAVEPLGEGTFRVLIEKAAPPAGRAAPGEGGDRWP
jgi:TusA-related sulfurtransferase